jgi:hypothetical protein
MDNGLLNAFARQQINRRLRKLQFESSASCNASGAVKKLAKGMQAQNVSVDNQRLTQTDFVRFQIFHSFSVIAGMRVGRALRCPPRRARSARPTIRDWRIIAPFPWLPFPWLHWWRAWGMLLRHRDED